MNREINQIIMKAGKSKLLEGLKFGKTLYIMLLDGLEKCVTGFVPSDSIYLVMPNYEFLSNGIKSISDYVSGFNRVVIYSNEKKNKNIKYINNICDFVGIDKCVFMFSSEN